MNTRQNLRERAAAAAGGEVATRAVSGQVSEGPTLRQQIMQMREQFALAMPRGAEAAQLIRDALTCLSTTPKLAECDPSTVLGGLMTCAQLGLRPGVLGHAWLLPFWDGKSRTNKAQLVIGYQGLVELAHRSGKIASLIARTVHENDLFEVEYGLEDRLVHRPRLDGDRGAPRGYYAIVKLTTGGHAFWYMGHDEMLAWRDKHAMARTRDGEIVGPWRDNFEQMAQKTVMLRLAKWLPKSTELAVAMEVDSSVRFNTDPTATPESTHHVIAGGPAGLPVGDNPGPPPGFDQATGEITGPLDEPEADPEGWGAEP